MIEFPGCFSCLNGLALDAGFIYGRFGWNLHERGVAATMAELAPFYNTAKSKNLRRANVLRRRPRETHLQHSSRRLPSVNFKKQKNYLLLFFFFLIFVCTDANSSSRRESRTALLPLYVTCTSTKTSTRSTPDVNHTWYEMYVIREPSDHIITSQRDTEI